MSSQQQKWSTVNLNLFCTRINNFISNKHIMETNRFLLNPLCVTGNQKGPVDQIWKLTTLSSTFQKLTQTLSQL